MNKKGFTLIELIAVIAIIGLLLTMVTPKLMENFNDKKNRLYDATIEEIERLSGLYLTDNPDLYSDISSKGYVDISIDMLCEGNYISCPINNPKDNSDIDGYVRVVYIDDKYNYSYLNKAVRFETDEWATIVAAVQSGSHPYQVGDTKEIDLGDEFGVYKIRVANTTPCSEVSVLSKTACGFVLEFADVITTYVMRNEKTNAGGWPLTNVRTYLNNEEDATSLYNLLPEKLKLGIIDTYVVSSHGKDDTSGTLENDNFESTDKLYLLSSYEVWKGNAGGYDTSATETITRQLDYYANYQGDGYTGVSTTNKEGAIKQDNSGSARWWWLRSARSNFDGTFLGVKKEGGWSHSYATATNSCISPAFRLSN